MSQIKLIDIITPALKLLRLCFPILLLSGCIADSDTTGYVDYVNPLIGTAPSTTISAMKHGHGTENNAQVVPFVTTPFGMTNWTPQTKDSEQKCLAPYYYTDTIIQGFRGSHWLSGSCVQDYGSVTIMPVSGKLKYLPSERGSNYTHDKEIATPYHYWIHLDDYNIDAELTATKRTGLFRFTFINSGEAHIVLNPNSDEGRGYVQILQDRNEIVGYNPVHRIYQGWGEEAGFKGYFVARFDKDIGKFGVFTDSILFENRSSIEEEMNLGGYVSFQVTGGEQIHVSIGTSFTSIEQARKNLDSEMDQLDFDQATLDLKEEWEKILSKIRVEGENEEDKIKFYTALYHSFLAPRTFNDCDGSYVSFAGGEHVLNSDERDYYADFSMWDTYRASYPLFNLLIPDASADMMKSLLLKAEQGGWLPIFPLWNSYTSAMIGDHVITSIADAYMKDIIDLSEDHYALLLKNAFDSPETYAEYEDGKGRRALKSYLEYGYIPLEDDVKESFHKKEQVSRTLEYAFDDFALSQVARKYGDLENAEHLKQRALNYQNVYSRIDSSVRGRFANGSFTEEFNKYVRQPYITEGTPYQYTWYVPHDVAGLMSLMGGEEGFNANLDRFHSSGQYWHGNEPGHQIPFLYNFSGQPWKTQQLVSEIMKSEYNVEVGGLSGNDDAGQMSAWYIFAALGFYPVCPAVPEYVISGPRFDKITLTLKNQKELVINAPGASAGNSYIHGLRINGATYDKNYLNHFDLVNGGVLDFELGTEPNKIWGTGADERPFSLQNSNN